MPISHLLSESFYVEKDQQGRPDNDQETLIVSLTNDSHPVNNSGRHVRFHDDTVGQTNFYSQVVHPTNIYERRTAHPQFEDEIKSTSTYSGRNINGYNNPDHYEDLRNKITYPQQVQLQSNNDMSVIPVLIDTDGGCFDAWALGLALKSSAYRTDKGFKIVGITTVNGCTTVENAVKNVGRVFHTTGENAENTFIFKGMDSPLVGTKDDFTRPAFYGSDGFGDVLQSTPLEEEPKVIAEHGVNAIIKLAQKYKGRLIILALGPLTNLAMAVKLQPKIRNQVKEIYIVGGNSEGIGNVTVCSEFNFHADPEAAHVVLESFNPCPLYLLPWETCMRSAASSYGFRTKTIGALKTPFISLLNKVEFKHLSQRHGDVWVAPDAVLVACFLDKKIMRKTENYYCSVELQGKFTRGMTVVDKNFLNQKPANVMLITEIDRPMYEAMLVEILTSQNHINHNASYDPQQGHILPLEVENHYF